MKIELKEITIKTLTDGFVDNNAQAASCRQSGNFATRQTLVSSFCPLYIGVANGA